MKSLTLNRVTFGLSLKQQIPLTQYLLYKYSQGTLLEITDPCILASNNSNNSKEQKTDKTNMTQQHSNSTTRNNQCNASSSTSPFPNYAIHFQQFNLKNTTENTFPFFKQFITDMQYCGSGPSQLTWLNISGGNRNRRKKKSKNFQPVHVDITWIEQVCPHLLDFTLVYGSLPKNDIKDKIRFKNKSQKQQLLLQNSTTPSFFYIALHRDDPISSPTAWFVQEFKKETVVVCDLECINRWQFSMFSWALRFYKDDLKLHCHSMPIKIYILHIT
ncbi:hypothetical protein BDA99DRAFT_573935 [Phascolomyces articulosus]|uniref:Uncharacterized protein n=1 Tax=Phascolomyces articulosus TaxID=60185 RepID=A0AAD5JVA0_9FUNG|nr:hypothetical protein BDA99DRAFT_573935 [Phascolomyces articulosus]